MDATSGERVARLYAALLERRTEIEDRVGGPLSWAELPERRAGRIACYTDGDVTANAQHDTYISWLIDSQARLRSAIAPAAEAARGAAGVGAACDAAGQTGP